MKKRSKASLVLAVCLLFGLAGCGAGAGSTGKQTVEGLDKLGNIQVIAREDGSGTRSAFAQMVGLMQSSAETEQSDETRTDAQIAESTDDVVEAVAADKAAIGYVSAGALTDDHTQIKQLTIDGSAAGNAKNNYPLSRSFYLAYSGTLSDAAQDFLTYVHGAGQALVAETYTPVAKSSTFLSSKASGSISIVGSTSVAPLIQQLAEAYQEYNPNVSITVEATDSSDGLTRAMSGECDLGMSSRDLKDYEQELLDYESIAQDDIAVIVQADNPLSDISLDLLKQIYTGDFKAWSELNS